MFSVPLYLSSWLNRLIIINGFRKDSREIQAQSHTHWIWHLLLFNFIFFSLSRWQLYLLNSKSIFKFSFKWINARNIYIFILKCWYKNIFSHFLVTELLTLSLGIYIKRQLCVFLDVKKESEKMLLLRLRFLFTSLKFRREYFSGHILLDNNLVNWNVEMFIHISISPFYNFTLVLKLLKIDINSVKSNLLFLS